MFHPNELQDDPKAPSKFDWAMFDEEWMLSLVIIIGPLYLFTLVIPFFKHAVLVFFAAGWLIEIVASLIWTTRVIKTPALAAIFTGIFWAGALITRILSLIALCVVVFVFNILFMPTLMLLVSYLALGRLEGKAKLLARQNWSLKRIQRYMLLSGLSICLIAALCAGSYYYLRPEIDQIPVFVTASDVQSTDWQSWDSGFSIDRKGRFITTASPEEVLNSYNNKLKWQGWRLVDEDMYFSDLDKSLTQVCCYSYWSGNGSETLLSIGYTQTSRGTHVQINLQKR
jgi:hypothetical protein